MHNRIEREICKYLVLAQIASDAGKGLYRINLNTAQSRSASKGGYDVKDYYIKKAIELLDRTPLRQHSIRYYISDDAQQVANAIVYFDLKINNRRYQMSYHTYDTTLANRVGKGRRTHWVHDQRPSDIGCLSTALLLTQHFNLARS